jgi:predicted HicB family RNase H-like nuclease
MMVVMAWLRIHVPDWVHRNLKAQAAVSGKTLHDYINEVLKKTAEQPIVGDKGDGK